MSSPTVVPHLTPSELTAVAAVVLALNGRSPDACWLAAHLSHAGRPVMTVCTHGGQREYRDPADDEPASPTTPHPGA